jgi:class 3 adenylate cyclase
MIDMARSHSGELLTNETMQKPSIYACSEKQIDDLKKMTWTKRIGISPVPEKYRYEFISAMLKQNFERMVLGTKLAFIVIGLLTFLLDVMNIQMTRVEILKEHTFLRYLLLTVLFVGYIVGKRLRITDPNASMMGFFLWANLVRGSFALIVYIMFYNLSASGDEITGAFAVFVGIFGLGLHANRAYISVLIAVNACIYAGVVIATTSDAIKIFDMLFTGFSMLIISAVSSSILFRSFSQEFAMMKKTEEERERAIELNEQLSQANEEVSRQMELLSEQSREIEIANTMLQERSLEVERERDRANLLLHNILPPTIAARLQAGEETIAQQFETVTVMFADIVGFTQLSTARPAAEIVSILNRIFSAFDIFSEQYGLEKIKTIGDAYMIVGGVPEPMNNHCESVCRMALEMLTTVELLGKTLNIPLSLRIGIHTGPVVAGVIGKKKFTYDLWGDTVNTASRMESHGEAGKIHVSEEVYEVLKSHRLLVSGHSSGDNTQNSTKRPMTNDQLTNDQVTNDFLFEERGEIEIKGKGFMRTFFLKGVP